jgi:hypothetical protein
LQNKHDGETAVVIGNGPSLNDVDLERLGKKFVTFGSNRIYSFPFSPTYYAIADSKMGLACIPDIVKLSKKVFNPEEMFLPRQYNLPFGNPINYVVKNDFSFDPEHELVIGGTVTYVLLQLAYYMGFRKIVLVGVDHNYPVASKGMPGSAFLATGEDLDHFKPKDDTEYFKLGHLFNRPELAGTTHAYNLARSIYEADGRKIVNCTRNSMLLVYDKEDIKKYYK